MPASHEPQSVIDAAEHAAAAGDYASAEQLLREAALQQETESGPFSPDLANTLNNLAIVCEMRHKDQDAERCYRQAYAIATAAFAPYHPLVATSRKNLRDFCEARGTSIAPPIARPAPAPRIAVQAITASAVARARALGVAWARVPRPLPIVVIGLLGLILAMVLMTRGSELQVVDSSAASETRRTPEPPLSGGPAASGEATPAALTAGSVGRPEPIASPAGVTSGPRATAGAAGNAARGSAALTAPAVATARLCRVLSTTESRGMDWLCEPAGGSVGSGSLFLYTRLKSPRDTTVQHLWYRDGRLYQAVPLRIRANQTNGFRTYSRYTMGGRSSGSWRVELRSREGSLLHEERFVVR
jgi:hypothetical protein